MAFFGDIALKVRVQLLWRFGFPDFFLLLWRSAMRVLKTLLVTKNPPVYAFTPFDFGWSRVYYEKLARNFKNAGRNGYVWDEILGLPMAGRFGSNTLTYALYGTLSPQQFSAFCLAVFFTGTLVGGLASGHLVFAMVICVMAVVSPAVVFSFVAYAIKPEVLWWGFSIPLLMSAIFGDWNSVWIMEGLLLVVNTSVSVIMGIQLGALVILALLKGSLTLEPAFLCFVLGAAVMCWRLFRSHRAGMLQKIVKEQKKTGRERWLWWGGPLFHQAWTYAFPFFLMLYPDWLMAALAWAGFTMVVLINVKIKIADSVTMELLALLNILVLGLYSASWLSILITVGWLYAHPFKKAPYMRGQKEKTRLLNLFEELSSWPDKERIIFLKKLLSGYPWINPFSFLKPKGLMDMFERIPAGARVLMEGDGDARSQSRYYRFHDWTYHFLPDRRIEFVNPTFYVRFVEPQLADAYLSNFNADHLTPGAMEDVCNRMGASSLITYSSKTTDAMIRQGFHPVVRVPYEEFAELADLLDMPETDLILLRNPKSAGIIEPDVPYQRKGRRLSFFPKAGQDYVLRYRYHPNFQARQSSARLAIEAFRPFEELPTEFMRIRARSDELIDVTFKRRWI
jgi:hypothetical protein